MIPEIEAHDLGNSWFKQNGAIPHASHQSIDVLREHFAKQIVLSFGRPRGITPLDFLLWEKCRFNSGLRAKYHT